MESMLSIAGAEIPSFGGGQDLKLLPWPPGDFLDAAHKRSLWATHLKGDKNLREEYLYLLCDLPESSVYKFSFDKLEGADGPARADMVVGLISKHPGEVVELDRRRSGWQLRAVTRGSASVAPLAAAHAQWYCREHSERAGHADCDIDYPIGVNDTMMPMTARPRTGLSGITSLPTLSCQTGVSR